MTARSDRARHFRDLNEPQRRGDATEAIVRAAFAVRGITACRPNHDNAPYDLVIDVDGRFYRIQAKTAFASRNDGAVQFETRTTRVKSDEYEREGYEGKADLFAVYDPLNDDVSPVPVAEAPGRSMHIRFEASASADRTNVNYRDDYLLDAALEDL